MPNFLINVKERGAKKAAGNIGTLTGSMKKMVAQAAVAGVALETMRKAIVRSAEIEGVRRGFDNLAKSAGFSIEDTTDLSSFSLDEISLDAELRDFFLLDMSWSNFSLAFLSLVLALLIAVLISSLLIGILFFLPLPNSAILSPNKMKEQTHNHPHHLNLLQHCVLIID